MLVFKDGNFEIESDSRKMTSEEVSAVEQVQKLLQAAHAEAEQLRKEAAEEAERVRREVAEEAEKSRKELADEVEKARQEGFQKGVDEGQESIVEQKIKMVEKSAAYLEQLEGRVVDVVEAVLQKCVGKLDCHDVVVGLTSEAMESIVRTQRQMTIRVASENLDVVKEKAEEWRTKYPSINMLNVVADNTLPLTGCVLETDAGVVDASLQVQLDAITRAFRKCFGRKE